MIQLIATAGRDGMLHLDVPAPAGEYEVTFFLAAKNRTHKPATDANGWPIGFFEATAGAITDPTFVAPERNREDSEPVKFEGCICSIPIRAFTTFENRTRTLTEEFVLSPS